MKVFLPIDNRMLTLFIYNFRTVADTTGCDTCVIRFYMCVQEGARRYSSYTVYLKDVAETSTTIALAALSKSLWPPPPGSKLPAGGGRLTGSL